MKKIKILHVVGAMNIGGLETFIMNLYRNIEREKFEFHFAVQTYDKGYYDDEILELGGKVIPHVKPNKNLKEYKQQFKNTLKSGNYDVVHSHTLHFSGITLKLASVHKVPIRISHAHSDKSMLKISFKRKIYEKYMRLLINKNATHKLGCSDSACKYLYGSIKDSIVIKNAIDIDELVFFKRSSQTLKKEFKMSSESILIGNIGRMVKSKNHIFMVDIIEQLIKINPNCCLILIGEGPEKSEVEKYVREKQLEANVYFLGARNDVAYLMNSFDLFLFPSFYEGLGIVLIESQAAGIPALASDTIPQEVDCNLNLIEYFPLSNSHKMWAEKIINVLYNYQKVNENLIKKNIYDNGYDIKSNIEYFSNLYRTSR